MEGPDQVHKEATNRRDRIMSTTRDEHGLPRMLTTAQVAAALGVASSTLCRWRAQGIGPRVFWIAEASPRYRETDVLAWLDGVAA